MRTKVVPRREMRSSLKQIASRAFLFYHHLKGSIDRAGIHHSDPTSEQDLRRRRECRPRPGGHQSGHPQGRDLRHHRPLRRGKEHTGALHEPAGAANQRQGPLRRQGDDRPLGKGAAAGPPGHHHDLSELQPADAAHLPEKRVLPHGAMRHPLRPGKKAGRGAFGAGGTGRQGGRLSRPALRRPEAAGGHRPGPG